MWLILKSKLSSSYISFAHHSLLEPLKQKECIGAANLCGMNVKQNLCWKQFHNLKSCCWPSAGYGWAVLPCPALILTRISLSAVFESQQRQLKDIFAFAFGRAVFCSESEVRLGSWRVLVQWLFCIQVSLYSQYICFHVLNNSLFLEDNPC